MLHSVSQYSPVSCENNGHDSVCKATPAKKFRQNRRLRMYE